MSSKADLMAQVQVLIASSDALPGLNAAKASADQAVNVAQNAQATAVANLNSGIAAEQQAVKALEAIAEALTADAPTDATTVTPTA